MKRHRRVGLIGVAVLASSIGYVDIRRTNHGLQDEAHQSIEDPSVASSPSPQPASVASPAAAEKPNRFRTLPVLERSAILSDIRKRPLREIFALWQNAGAVEKDPMKQGAIATVLAFAIPEREPNPEFLAQVKEFIEDNANTSRERAGLIGVLSAAATKESLDLLLHVATTLDDKELRGIAISSVRRVGKLDGAGEQLSPALERTWRESDDQELLISVAVAMAKVGAPSGVELLLSAALATDNRDKVRMGAAQGALMDVYKSNAVPPLAARLANQSPVSDTGKLAAVVLVRVGDATASNAVVAWLQGTAESAAPLINKQLFQETRTPAMLAAWKAALDPAVPFRNEQNREAIRAGLAAYDAGTTHVNP